MMCERTITCPENAREDITRNATCEVFEAARYQGSGSPGRCASSSVGVGAARPSHRWSKSFSPSDYSKN